MLLVVVGDHGGGGGEGLPAGLAREEEGGEGPACLVVGMGRWVGVWIDGGGLVELDWMDVGDSILGVGGNVRGFVNGARGRATVPREGSQEPSSQRQASGRRERCSAASWT